MAALLICDKKPRSALHPEAPARPVCIVEIQARLGLGERAWPAAPSRPRLANRL